MSNPECWLDEALLRKLMSCTWEKRASSFCLVPSFTLRRQCVLSRKSPLPSVTCLLSEVHKHMTPGNQSRGLGLGFSAGSLSCLTAKGWKDFDVSTSTPTPLPKVTREQMSLGFVGLYHISMLNWASPRTAKEKGELLLPLVRSVLRVNSVRISGTCGQRSNHTSINEARESMRWHRSKDASLTESRF